MAERFWRELAQALLMLVVHPSSIMTKQNVEKLLFAGGADKATRLKYDQVETREKFVAAAAADGYEFPLAELDDVLKDEDMSFESEGNPRCRSIWLR